MNNSNRFAQPSKKYLYLAISLLAALLYLNSLGHGFVFDDEAVLKSNSYVQKGLGGLGDIFTKGSWDGFDPSVDMHIYRPLQLAFLALQYEFFELEPFGYHAVHVATYVLTCCLVFSLLGRLFKNLEHGKMLAFLATVIFTAHPVHTEVVANIKGNGDLIAMLLGTASLIFLWDYSQKGSRFQLAAASCLFLLALLSKETIVCFVGVAALMLYFFSKNTIRQTLVTLLPLLVMVVIYLGLRSLVFGEDAQTLTQTTEFDNYIYMADGLSQELGLRLYALGKNLQLCLVPYPLQFMYVYDSVPMVEFWDIRSIFSLVAYLLIGLAFLFNLNKNNIWGFAIGYYLVTLALFSNTVFSIPNILSERWLLMPSLGAAIAIAYMIVLLMKINRKAATGILLLLMVGYSGYTIERSKVWESNFTLFETDIQVAPRNAMANRFLATLYLKKADSDASPEASLRKAAYYQERFVELAPDDAAQHHKLGKIYEKLGEHRKAAELFNKVAGLISPLQEEAEFLFAKNANAGLLYRDALPVWTALRQREPQSIEIAAGYTVALLKLGNKDKAEEIFQGLIDQIDASKGDQEPSILLNNLGIQLEEMGAYEKAARAFELAAADQSPIQDKAAFSRAKNLNMANLYSKAVPFWFDLNRDYPGLISVQSGLTTALIGSGRKVEALKAAEVLINTLHNSPKPKLSEKEWIAINSIAVSLENWGAHKTAADLFAHVAGADSPVRGKATFSLAKNLNIAGSYQEALAVWLELQKEFPGVAEIYMGKAEAFEALNETAKAIQAYNEVIDLAKAGNTGKNLSVLSEKALKRIRALKGQ